MPESDRAIGAELHLAEDGSDTQLLRISLAYAAKPLPRNWTLHLDLLHAVTAGPGTRLLRQVGSHVIIAPVVPQGSTLFIRMPAGSLQRLSDLPRGLYVAGDDGVTAVRVVAHDFLVPPHTAPVSPEKSPPAVTPVCPLIPVPRHFDRREGVLPLAGTFLVVSEAGSLGDLALRYLGQAHPLSTSARDLSEVTPLRLLLQECPLEAYRLTVGPKEVTLSASDAAGFFYGAVSLVQLLASGTHLPCCVIEDAPRYRHRGFMLDCARHFHSVEEIRKLLDAMASYKLNRFHWHLTDDEAWRLEIGAYPALTDIGAWRGHDEVLEPQFGSGPGRYGGYYSRQAVRDIVAHAAALNITVIPEIDIPGHSRAAIRALPELLAETEDRSSYCSVQYYRDNVLNPGLPGTYTFLDTVLAEVCALFPGPWVHMGADEVPEGVWLRSPACKALMVQAGYRTARQLQGYLLSYAQQRLARSGRTLIGWEEAAEGCKLEKSAIICAWTEPASTARMRALGYPVIACPAPHTYHDLAWSSAVTEPGLHWAGTTDLETCYRFEPDESAGDLLGVQAQLWSELLSSADRLEYMLFPRLLASAETAWSPASRKDWPDFYARVKLHQPLLEQRRIAFRPLQPCAVSADQGQTAQGRPQQQCAGQ
ncbi:beta-N-acetylhexosaminidase [Microbulbifer sp. 2205BS26-8]|uniref:beta-N-acetylhexosaminidase n=1 Tax=Microbulbifer sp. 2205BS26-8 TaxID=3064386 RepID=UPI00273FD340|nr:beta-N-acetylhexosaminidase [Microbulbifer sp. 2205BS26-8]MDP5209884.1 beta-N-acetylhexosaminidase [Microbulbifer sp. 2205BS26-8]